MTTVQKVRGKKSSEKAKLTPEELALSKVARQKRLQDRLQRQLALIGSMPDEAAIDVNTLSALKGRSVASIWRDVKAGRFPAPFKAGPRSTRWRLGNVRGVCHEK